MLFASEYQHPCSLRYPRGSFTPTSLIESTPFILGKSQLLYSGDSDILFIGYGNGVGRAYETAKLLDIDITVLDLRFVKPLDEEILLELSRKNTQWFVFSDSSKMGGVGSAILEFLAKEKITNIQVTSFEYEDEFITHGNTLLVEESLGLLPKQLARKVKNLL